jgi:hypothetical protein
VRGGRRVRRLSALVGRSRRDRFEILPRHRCWRHPQGLRLPSLLTPTHRNELNCPMEELRYEYRLPLRGGDVRSRHRIETGTGCVARLSGKEG